MGEEDNILNVGAALLTTIAEAIGIAGISTPTVQAWLGLASALFTIGDDARDQMVALDDHVSTMINENREPTEEEWAFAGSLTDDAHSIIQSWRAPPDDPPTAA